MSLLIGTHDIQNITSVADTSVPGQIRVMATFVDGSTATGVLVIVYSMTAESDIQYIVKQTEQSVTVSLDSIISSIHFIHSIQA